MIAASAEISIFTTFEGRGAYPSSAQNLRMAQRDRVSAESAEVQARVNYAKSLVAYQVAIGSLLEHNGIDADAALRATLWVEHP